MLGSALRHPNVIQTIDLIVEGGKCYEVMEYCSTDLFQYIQKGKYGVEEVHCSFKQIIRGVAYLHSLGIAHR
jgi:serine/threonine protein kinase